MLPLWYCFKFTQALFHFKEALLACQNFKLKKFMEPFINLLFASLHLCTFCNFVRKMAHSMLGISRKTSQSAGSTVLASHRYAKGQKIVSFLLSTHCTVKFSLWLGLTEETRNTFLSSVDELNNDSNRC